ncbi:Glycosyltransferase AglG, partial [ANME-1 cluster archaeon GoMg3.2]|nr:Glycosyltransferase AglG [ANME-1 cluster archaeon GoMg3.2]
TNISGQLDEKEQQINELNAAVQGRNEHIQNFERQITNISSQLNEKEQQINELNGTVQGKDEQLRNLEGQITDFSGQLKEKEQQINELNGAVQGKDEQLRNLEGQITDFSGQLNEKEQQINELNGAVQRKDEQIQNLERQITDFSGQLAEKDKKIDVLNVAVLGKEEQIMDLDEQITEFSGRQKEKEQRITELNVAVLGKEEQIRTLEGQITNISSQLREMEGRIREIEMENLRIDSELNSIKSSVTWRTVMKWHFLVEKVLLQGTRRRRYYDLSIIGLRTITNEGWKCFWWKYKQHRSSKKHTGLIAKSTEERLLETARDKTEPSNNSLDTFKSYKLLNFLSQPGVNLSFPKFKEPVVSIITLTFNKVEFTYQYLESILAHTDIPYDLIIVDNGSQDETTSLLDRVENVSVIKNNENLGFIKGCNQGASKAKGRYLLFLNNDINVTPGWLSKLVRTIENYPKCGAVGCKLIWPNGKLQEAGSIIWSDGSALGYGREGDPMQPEYSYLREVDYCSGACLLVRKDIFQQLGLFDERYSPAYYEDSDLCIGIWGLGYKVLFQPDVVVFHHEFTSSSFNKATALMATNQSKFVAKRKDTLRDKLDSSPNNVLFARDLRQGNRILVIDDRVPTPYQGSGYPRAYHMLKFLGELGYKVTFFPLDNATPWQPYTNELQQLGIEVFYGDNLDFIRFAHDRTGYYDLILVSRPHNMEMAVDAIKRFFSNAVLLYDAEAMFSLREILKAKIKGIKQREPDAERMINGEIDLMNKADLIMTVSRHEKKIIVEKGNLNNIVVWGHPIDVKNPKTLFRERKDILFVGGFLASESPNEDAVLYFAKEVFPKLREAISCRFFITGLNPPDSIKKLSSSSVIVTGYVEDLREYYEKCRVFVVPHRYSAGISWKLQEAMSYGIPAVVSQLTASQLDLTDGNEVLIAKNTDEFVQKIIKIYQDEKLWYQIQQNALKYIQRTCNSETMKTALNEIVKNGLQTKKQRVR